MTRKVIVSGPIHGAVKEAHVDKGPGRAVRRTLYLGRRPGTKSPPPDEGYALAREGRSS